MPDFLNGLFFSEILADNAGTGATDTNQDGSFTKQDEFVEIQNKTGSAIDLEGYQIWSGSIGLLHTFGAGDEIAAGGTATVVGTYASPPDDFYSANGSNNGASQSGGFLEDGEGSKRDILFLVDPDGNYILLSYGLPPDPPGALPPGFPSGGALQGIGESINSGAPNGVSIIRDADGNLIEGTPTPGTAGNVCFVEGSMITTIAGQIAVEDMEPGIMVLTKDKGFAPLRAVRRATLGRSVLKMNPDLRPVVLPQNLVQNETRLMISPPHRVLLSDIKAELLFDSSEVLVAARHLVGLGGVHVDLTDRPVSYFHLLFDEHEIVRSNGCWTESLFLGDATHAALSLATGWDIAPGVDIEAMRHERTARPVLKKHETKLLCADWAPTTEILKVAA